MLPLCSQAERVKDLAAIQGVRENQLIGYGLVVGLDGSGDQTTQTPFTIQSVVNMLQQMGTNLSAIEIANLQLKNVAAVVVTTSLPPFAQPGQTLDVTVSSMGNAKSLSGGTLLMTPLKGADGKVYAMSQGNVLVGTTGGAPPGAKVTPNHLSVGRISNGATVERAVPSAVGQGNLVFLELNQSDFSTASRVVDALNQRFGPDTAAAQDARVIRVKAPAGPDDRVAFLGALESVNVTPAAQVAKVVINARTGSVVMNTSVTLEPCAVAHGSLSVVVNSEAPPSAAGAAVAPQIEVAKDSGQVLMLKGGASLSDVVKALNAIGATPQDLLSILQAMKAAGSLRAELDII
ncbi:MAG TPA: flagellar basal body P-ring protein FlgI [Burkholderiaceae bacterium]